MRTWIAILGLFLGLPVAAATPATGMLFTGRALQGWHPIEFYTPSTITVLESNGVVCARGKPLAGMVYTNAVPTMNYEVSLEAMRVEGSDFFIGLTLPIEKSFFTVIIGGWGGNLCGISSFDYDDASQNPWSESVTFENNRWYTLRVRITPGVLQIFLNDTLYHARIEFDDATRFSLRPGEIEKSKPFGLTTYETKARWRNLRIEPITQLLPLDQKQKEP